MKVRYAYFIAIALILLVICSVIVCLLLISTPVSLPKEVTTITNNMYVIVKESPTDSRILYLNSNNWYCKITIFYGGSNPYPHDLAYPYAPIVFFFLEDIENQTLADNWSDLIIRMNPIIENDTQKMCVVFFAEGAYEKMVYYKNQLKYHYRDNDPTSNYNITTLEIDSL